MTRGKAHASTTREQASFQSIYDDLQALGTEKARGDAFERVVVYFLRNDPVWSQRLGLDQFPSQVRLWQDAHEWRWSRRDTGTDLLAKDLDGKLWAVKAKCWRDDLVVRKDEIDSFLSDSSRPTVWRRILVTTASRISGNARATIEAQEKPVDVITCETLFDSRVQWPASLADLLTDDAGLPSVRNPRSPRSHQERAIESVIDGFVEKGNLRGQVLMASGSGKTLVAQRVAEQLGSRTTIVLVPSLMLLGQTLRDWCADAEEGETFEWIAVCSDSTVERGGPDQFVERTADLGIPNVTTSPDDIRSFLKERRKRGRNRKVIFATYQSSAGIAEAIDGVRQFKFDLVICDEAHRMARVSRRATKDDSFTLPLDDSRLPARRRLFMIATPRVFSVSVKLRAEAGGYEDLRFCMEDQDVFGPVLHDYSFRDAIKDEVLADYRVLAIVVSGKEIDALIGEQTTVLFEAQGHAGLSVQDAASAASQVAIVKSMQTDDAYGITSAITYHNSIRAAESFAADHNKFRGALGLPSIAADSVRGSDPAYVRTRKLRILENHSAPAILSNARFLTEGIDVPLLDAVAFIEPRYSVIDIAQAIGRAIRRPSAEKRIGYVIVPVYIPDEVVEALRHTVDEDVELASDSPLDEILQSRINQSFSGVIEVLQALRSLDGILAEQIRELRVDRGRRRSRGRSRSRAVSFSSASGTEPGTLPVIVDARAIQSRQLSDASIESSIDSVIDLNRFADSISLLLLDEVLARCSESWWERFGALQDAIRELGGFPRSSSADDETARLGLWGENQRVLRKRGTLRPERVTALESLPGWLWDVKSGLWMANFEGVRHFLNEHGSLPSLYGSTPAERGLGLWIVTQRQRRKGRRNKRELTSQEEQLLESLPGWSWGPQGDAWERQRVLLQEFYDLNGRLPRSAGSGYVRDPGEEERALHQRVLADGDADLRPAIHCGKGSRAAVGGPCARPSAHRGCARRRRPGFNARGKPTGRCQAPSSSPWSHRGQELAPRRHGLWAWISLVWINSLCPVDSAGRREVKSDYRLIPETGYKSAHHHLLRTPYLIYDAYPDDLSKAMVVLCGDIRTPGEASEQFASRQDIWGSPSILGVATDLYYDRVQDGLKRGAAGAGPGSARRFGMLLNQYVLTWDFYEKDSAQIASMLPPEFDRFRTP